MSDKAPTPNVHTSAPRDVIDTMQAALVDSSRSGAIISRCTLLEHRQRDGHRGATQYEVELSGVEVGNESRQLVSALSLGGPRTRRLWRQIEAMDLPDIIPGTGLRPFAYSPAVDLLFQVFPFDARLPTLRQLTPSPSPEIATVLNDDFAEQHRHQGSWRGEIVRYRPDMRATVRLEMVARERSHLPGHTHYFAKVFREPEQAQHASLIQESLFRSLGPEQPLLQVARPVALATSYSTLVTAAIPGTPLDRILKRSRNSVPHVRATARAIAGLHHLQAAAPERSVATEISHIQQSAETVTATYPALESRVRTITENVTSGLRSAPMSFVHGDLKPEHIIVDDDGRVAVIDFDLSVMADPMIDLAHFIAFLERSTSRSHTRENENASLIPDFLDEYFAHAPGDGRPRIALYHAASAVHKTAGLCRMPTPENSQQAEQILDEALRFVSGELSSSEAPSFKRRITRTR